MAAGSGPRPPARTAPTFASPFPPPGTDRPNCKTSVAIRETSSGPPGHDRRTEDLRCRRPTRCRHRRKETNMTQSPDIRCDAEAAPSAGYVAVVARNAEARATTACLLRSAGFRVRSYTTGEALLREP